LNINSNPVDEYSAEQSLLHYRHSIEFATGVPFTENNAIKVLQNGDEIFPAMLGAIENASTTIDFLTFVYWKGEIAKHFAVLLAEKAKRGVTVRVLLDSFGAKLMEPGLVDLMKTAGVEVRWFRPLATWRIWRTDKRTHRKILICDNNLGFTGGVGIAEQWTGDARNVNEWRDTHVQITGPALLGLRAAFLDNWNESGDWLYEEFPSTSFAKDLETPIQVLRASNTTGWTDIAGLVRALIAISKKSLYIVTAYFVPDQVLVKLLVAAKNRGVQINLLLPGRQTDSRLSQLAGHHCISGLLAAGVNIWLYQKTLLHAKIIIVDDYVSCVGSANLNHRSMGKDEECCVVGLSSQLAAELVNQFETDCKDSSLLDYEDWRSRGKWLKFKETFARLFAEQL